MQLFTTESLEVISDLLTNLAAGWLATIVIFPGIWNSRDAAEIYLVLFSNIFFGMVSLIIAVILKKEAKYAV